ncbi:MAG: hypothetical protein JWP10_608 [Nocardioidaceae bacterium]|nr:hypothetical protein [Nocardioidaceae bacterium]
MPRRSRCARAHTPNRLPARIGGAAVLPRQVGAWRTERTRSRRLQWVRARVTHDRHPPRRCLPSTRRPDRALLDHAGQPRRASAAHSAAHTPAAQLDRRSELDAYDAAREIHGIPHMSVVHGNADLFRANEVVIAGPRLLIFSSYAIRRERPVVGQQLRQLLRRGGFRG